MYDTCGCATQMFRNPDFVFDGLDLRDLVQLQIGDVGAHSLYREVTPLPLELIVVLVPVTRTID